MGERNQSIDLIKIIAMFGVIALHVFIRHIDCNVVSLMHNNIPVLSIPLFFMVSGYLMQMKQSVCFGYVVRKILKIILFVSKVSLIVLLFRYFFRNETISISFFLDPYLFRGPISIFWYFGSIIILYAVSPWLNQIVNARYVHLLLFLWFFLLQIVFICNCIWGTEYYITQSLRIYTFAFYYMIGAYVCNKGIGNLVFSKQSTRITGKRYLLLISCLILLEFLIFFVRKYIIVPGGFFRTSYFYTSIPCIFGSYILFVHCLKLNVLGNRVVSEISKVFLPVYTLHPLFIDMLETWNWEQFHGMGVLVEYLLVSFLSISFSLSY